MGLFSKMKKAFKEEPHSDEEESADEEYVELDTAGGEEAKSHKFLVRPYVMEDFSDIKAILDALREGHTIALINIKPLKEKDLVELKRAINKLKKTCDALNGDIAGFGDDYIVATPSVAEIHRNKQTSAIKEEE